MKGVGGPLLCIGDLLSDLEEKQYQYDPPADHYASHPQSLSPSSSIIDSNLDLNKLFQENYTQLNKALSGTDHSWTALTLKLCTSLETVNKLIQSTNSNVTLLSERVQELEKIIKREDSTVAAAKATHVSLNQKGSSFSGCQNVE